MEYEITDEIVFLVQSEEECEFLASILYTNGIFWMSGDPIRDKHDMKWIKGYVMGYFIEQNGRMMFCRFDNIEELAAYEKSNNPGVKQVFVADLMNQRNTIPCDSLMRFL